MKKIFMILVLLFISTNIFSEELYCILKIAKKWVRKDIKISKKGESGYRAKLDKYKDGVACETR